MANRKTRMPLVWGVLMSLLTAGGTTPPVRAQNMPPALSVDDIQLVLNGAGFRETWWVKVYAVGLYLPQRTAELDFIRDPETPKAIRVHVTYDEGTKAQDVPDTWHEEIRPEVSSEQMQRLNEAYARLQQGDVILVTYLPQSGSTVWKNGRRIVTDPGQGLVDGLLSIWLGSDPVSENLKSALLGRKDTE